MVFTPPTSPVAEQQAGGSSAAGRAGVPGVQAGGVSKTRRDRPFSGGGQARVAARAPRSVGEMELGGGGRGAAPGGHADEGGADDDAPPDDQTCWMCQYQTDEESKRLMEFVARHVGYIDIQNIAAQVSTFIAERFEHVTDGQGNAVELKGATPRDVERHLRHHVLHPKVRISVIVQELLDFKEHLRKNLVVEDVATGLSAVDKGNVELYLKVISQVMHLYKSEPNTMLFASDET